MTSRAYQYFATLSGNIAAMVFGITVSWVSPVVPVLLTSQSALPSGPITKDQASWINSSTCLGAIAGNLIYGTLVDRIGRKWSLFLLTVPHAISFLLILFAQDAMYLLISRIIGGIAGGGLFVVLPIYVNEISEDKIRGRLGSALIVSDNSGILIGYVIGSYMTISTFPYVVLTMVTIFASTFLFFPETPYYLLLKNRPAEAEKSLKFYRGVTANVKNRALLNFQAEFEKMKNLVSSATKKDSVTMRDLTSPTVLRAILISLVLLMGTDFCGIFAIVTYTTSIFHEAGSDLSPSTSSIIVAGIQVLGSFVATWLVDHAGRKILLIVSATGTALCHTALGIHLFLKASGFDMSNYGWLPLSALSGAVFICNIGINNLPFFIFAELLPPKILGFLATAFLFISWIIAFLVLLYYTYFVETFGMYTCYWFFAGFCFFEALFVLFIVPETKGKSFEAIQEALGGRRKPTQPPTVYTIN
ncbi:facilitated trehalose transporter Tret1-like [Phlebotomus papatasi]|uniref:facilitated trehalose transporter Tret1-like n=1 Tax=Phlebotomus papatasi TaxID=29031 RepID=UPI002483AAD4|nr:facilitated trehalose transporter Tret1-like [Phlebotomus papatasi]